MKALFRFMSLIVVVNFVCSVADAQPTFAWASRQSSPAARFDGIAALKIEPATGNAYVTGKWSTSATRSVFATLRIDQSNGQVLASAYYPAPPNLPLGLDEPKDLDLLLDGAGNVQAVFVTGKQKTTNGFDIVTIKYSANLVQQGSAKIWDGAEHLDDEGIAISVNSDGGLVAVTGNTRTALSGKAIITISYDTNLTSPVIWIDSASIWDDTGVDVVSLGVGRDIWTASSAYDAADFPIWRISKYQPGSPSQVWTRTFFGASNTLPRSPVQMAVDLAADRLVLTGYNGTGPGQSSLATVTWTASGGTYLWSQSYQIAPGMDKGNSCLIRSFQAGPLQGTWVWVTGESTGAGGNLDIVTFRLNALTGSQVCMNRWDGGGTSDDRGVAISVDDFGNAYVAARTQRLNGIWDFGVVKYNSLLQDLWSDYYNGPGNAIDIPSAIGTRYDLLTGKQWIYLAGTSVGAGTAEDFATVKYTDP